MRFSVPAFLIGATVAAAIAFWPRDGDNETTETLTTKPATKNLGSAIAPKKSQPPGLIAKQLGEIRERSENQFDYWKKAWPISQDLRPSELPALAGTADQANRENPDRERAAELELLLFRWCEHDPEAALRYCQQWPLDHKRTMSEKQIVGQWSSRDPEAALAWYKKTATGNDSIEGLPNLRTALIGGIFKTHPDEALALLKPGDLNEHALLKRIEFNRSEDWRKTLDTNPQFDRLAGQWAAQEPTACAEWLIERAPKRRATITAEAGQEIVVRAEDPIAMADKLWEGIETNAEAGVSIALGLARANPNLAGEWLGANDDNRALDLARARFAISVASSDPKSAFAWMESVKDARARSPWDELLFRIMDDVDPLLAESSFSTFPNWDAEKIRDVRAKR